jgi:hypothetical protein
MSRLGQMLVEEGVLTPDEVAQVLEAQAQSGRPFGLLCERLLGIAPSVIEDAWARQYAAMTRTIDPVTESFDSAAIELVSRRQAWQFRVLPIRFDDQDLMMATTQAHLRRALGFATQTIGVPVYFVLCEPQRLGEALCLRYPLPGLTPATVMRGVSAALNGL